MNSFPQQQGPATQALLESTRTAWGTLSDEPIFETEQRTQRGKPSKGMKRSLALSGSFDMSEFLKASQQVEDSISFPSIEWPSIDDESDNESDEECYDTRSSKRQCRGLVRCGRSSNLSSMTDMTSHHTTERRGSSGSLS